VVCCEEQKEIPEVVCGELQLLEVPVCGLSGKFSMGSHNSHTVGSVCSPTPVQG
jgi:hypothetical protein